MRLCAAAEVQQENRRKKGIKKKKKQVNNRCDEGRDGREMQMCEGELQSSGRVLQQSMTR